MKNLGWKRMKKNPNETSWWCWNLQAWLSPVMQDQNNVGLSRDDGLGIFRNLAQPNIERKKIEIIEIFKSFGLSTAVTTNATSAN